jgi:hypothetical protein
VGLFVAALGIESDRPILLAIDGPSPAAVRHGAASAL